MIRCFWLVCLFFCLLGVSQGGPPPELLQKYCRECHSADTRSGGLDLTSLPLEPDRHENFARWVKIHDRLKAGEMPPPDYDRPTPAETQSLTTTIKTALVDAETARYRQEPRTGVRRLTRSEYEHTLRDLFDMPGLIVRDELPEDGSAHGFDNNSEALEISHVNLAKYLEAADKVLDMAIATQPRPPVRKTVRVSVACEASTLGACILEGDGVMLRDRQPDPKYPPAGKHRHLDYVAHLQLGMHVETSPGTSVGVFRHEDDSFRPSFAEYTTIYPGLYRIKTAFWSFQWDKGKMLPAPKSQTARLDVWHITGDGRGTGHPSTRLGYFDAPSLEPQPVEFIRWLNNADTFGFNYVDSQVGHEIRNGKERLLGWSGPGLAVDHLEIDGPIHDTWPPLAHRHLFGDLPLVEFQPEKYPGLRPPQHKELTQRFGARNQADPPVHTLKLHTVHSDAPLVDADRLLAAFLPRAFRRPVSAELRREYVTLVEGRLQDGDCFESALRGAYRAALCSPDFLYHIEEPAGEPTNTEGRSVPDAIDEHALACRLSYFFWNSLPDALLTDLATRKVLRQPETLRAEVERLLQDPKAERFRDDFLGQWLKLRKIAANDPDPKLYGGFRVVLQDAMVAETKAYFQELLARDLGATYLVKSDFAMLNERLANYYGIAGVTGCQMRRVPVPADSPRGPFLTQAAILKVTANGTTTSPVVRGAFVTDRLFGSPPEPPPGNVPAVEPDVRGATTIREQLALHRNDPTCAGCHAKMDPPGFALESFDVIGGFRERYRTITEIKPVVDPSGQLADGRAFRDIREFQSLVVADVDRLLKNMAERFAVYALGRGLLFSDRDAIEALVTRTKQRGGGLRTLLHELVQSELFQKR
ncbi:MAG: DUF1592 domain-containing protein [Planctomycetes bacterium]|nr:DUF1592 domain-containing protein [Planctomycetota bacterium]